MPRHPVFRQAASHFPEILFALACAMAAGSVIAQSPPDPDHGRPVELVVRDLGVTPEQFREAFKKVRSAPRGLASQRGIGLKSLVGAAPSLIPGQLASRFST